MKDFGPWRLGTLAAISMILRSGSRDVQISPRQKLPVHSLCQDLGIRDLTPVSRECTVSGLGSIQAFLSENKDGIM